MRNIYAKQLEDLNYSMIEMGSMCEEIIATVTKALEHKDLSYQDRINTTENDIDHKESEIEQLCVRIILQQQPIASDLRQVTSALKMITDLERIGDHASDISEFIPYLAKSLYEENETLNKMAEETINMVSNAITSYVKKDVSLAEKIMKKDDIIDEYFVKVRNNIIDLIAENKEDGEYLLDLLMTAKYYERMGDHATNIAEWAIYSVTGEKRSAQ